MERIEKIRSIINNWRHKFRTGKGQKTKHITSRQANRNFINILKGRRTINRWRRRVTYHNPYPIIPSAPYISDGWYPPRMLAPGMLAPPTPSAPLTVDIAEVILNDTPMPH